MTPSDPSIESRDWNGWSPGAPLLENKVALVAGGGRGIGEATTRILAAAGATVAVMDNEPERAEAVAGTDRGQRRPGDPHRRRPARRGRVRRARSRSPIAELGGVDVLANVAGGMQPVRQVAAPPALDHRGVGRRRAPQPALRVLALPGGRSRSWRRGAAGSIVSVTSISGVFGAPNHSAYGAAKAGLIHLTKTLAVECGRSGIRVNAVSPGASRDTCDRVDDVGGAPDHTERDDSPAAARRARGHRAGRSCSSRPRWRRTSPARCFSSTAG